MSVTAMQRMPVPSFEPPFDDDRGRRGVDDSPRATVQGTLALAFVLPTGLPAAPSAAPDLRLVTAPLWLDDEAMEPEAETDEDEAEFGPQPTSTSHLPDARWWSGRFTQAVVEVLAGDRPAAQLIRWTTSIVYDDVVSLVSVPSVRRTPVPRGVVRSLHVSHPGDGVAEVAGLVRKGVRSTAVALRMEGLDGRWQCTALELG